MRTCTVTRLALFAIVTAGAACATDEAAPGGGSGSGSGSGSGGQLMPPARGFQIVTPEITIEAGQEITYCYYFKTPNTEAYTVKRWVSNMTAGSHHLILFFTPQLAMPEGTVSASQCGIAGGGVQNIPSWIYSAQTADADMLLPADDGTGQPVGMDVAPGQAAYVQLHYVNRGDEPLVVRATINAEAYEAGVTTTKTFAYVTYDGSISIPAQTNGHTESQVCNIPATANMWMLSTHAHQLAVRTEVKNDATVVFESTDWEHPGAMTWMTAPFYKFSSGKLTTTCTYNNPSNSTVVDGDSAQTEEMCMASGYIFPATKPTICYNGFVLP